MVSVRTYNCVKIQFHETTTDQECTLLYAFVKKQTKTDFVVCIHDKANDLEWNMLCQLRNYCKMLG